MSKILVYAVVVMLIALIFIYGKIVFATQYIPMDYVIATSNQTAQSASWH